MSEASGWRAEVSRGVDEAMAPASSATEELHDALGRLQARIECVEMQIDQQAAEVECLDRKTSNVVTDLHKLEVVNDSKRPGGEHTDADIHEATDKLENKIAQLQEKLEGDVERLKDGTTQDRTRITKSVDQLRRRVETVDRQHSETAGGVQALHQWRLAVEKQIDDLYRAVSGRAGSQLSAASYDSASSGSTSTVSADRVARLERQCKKDIEDRVQPLVKSVYDTRKTQEDHRKFLLDEINGIRTQVEERISVSIERVKGEFSMMLANVRNEVDVTRSEMKAVSLQTEDRLTEMRKTLEPDLRVCMDEVERLRVKTRDFSTRNNLIWSNVAEVKQDLEVAQRKIVQLDTSVNQLKDVIKDLLSRLFDKHIKPLQQQLSAINQALRRP